MYTFPLFELERQFFDAHRKEWVEAGHEGKWSVVFGDRLLGFFESPGTAWRAGISEFGKPGFMIKRLRLVDEPVQISPLPVCWHEPPCH